MFLCNGAPHEDDEERDDRRKNLIGDEIAERSGRGDGRGIGLLPGSGKEDDEKVRQHPEEITPTGGTSGSVHGQEIGGI